MHHPQHDSSYLARNWGQGNPRRRPGYNSFRLQWHLGQVGPRVGACLSDGETGDTWWQGRAALPQRVLLPQVFTKGVTLREGARRALRVAVGKGWARWRGSRGHSSKSAGAGCAVAVWALRASRKNTMAARKDTPMPPPRIPVFWGVGCTCLLGLALEMWSGPWGLSRASFAIQPRPRLRTLLDGAGPQAPGVTWLVEQNADVEALYF